MPFATDLTGRTTAFVTESRVLKVGYGLFCTLIVNEGPAVGGGIYDCASLADADPDKNLIVGNLPIGKPAAQPFVVQPQFPFKVGLTVVIDGTPRLAIAYT